MSEPLSNLPEQRGDSPRVTCPTCHSIVLSEHAVCPICGNQLRGAAILGYESPTGISVLRDHRKKRRIVLAIVLIALGLASVASYYAYDIFWVNNPVLNAAAEPSSASKAVDSLTLICATTTPWDKSDPSRAIASITMGVRNRSGYPMDTRWTFFFRFPSAGVFVTSSQVFHLAGRGDTYPKFQITMNSDQIQKLQSAPYGVTDLVVSASRSFNVTGLHGTYQFTRYDTGHQGILGVSVGGEAGMVLGPPPCP